MTGLYKCSKCKVLFKVINENEEEFVGFQYCPFCGKYGFNRGDNEFSETNKGDNK